MQAPLLKTTFPEYVAQLDACLARVEAFGLSWRNTRFERYRNVLKHAASAVYPRVVKLDDPAAREQDRLLREAAVQCEQLMLSAETWDEQPADVLAAKLRLVLKGKGLPSTSAKDDDEPRNTLAELATAALLKRRGFQVVLTASDEDILATVPELHPFAIECKRPTSEAGIERNLRDLRKQLRARCKAGDRYGFAVLAVDRLSGVSGGMLNAQSEAHLRAVLDAKLQSMLRKVQALVTHPSRPKLHLYPSAMLLGCLFVGTVFLQDRGMPVTVGLLAASSAAPDHAVEPARVIEVVKRYMGA